MRVISSRLFLTLSALLGCSASDVLGCQSEDISLLQVKTLRETSSETLSVPVDITEMHSEPFEVPDDLKVEHKVDVFTHMPKAQHISQLSIDRGTSSEASEALVVSSCDQMRRAEDVWERKYQAALKDFCSDPDLAPMVEVTLDPQFKAQYAKYYSQDGWTEKAWVNYVGVKGPNDPWGLLTKKMAESAKRASEYPVVIVNFGDIPLTDIPSAEFPNVVLLHAKGIPGKFGRLSFNFNKLRAILLARVKAGVSLDGDMLMVSRQADSLLERTREEITEDYPFPMMPVHFLDRDPRDENISGWREGQGNFLAYTCESCPPATMRWGQAQPSWTYWSFPFVSRWLSAKVRGQSYQGVNVPAIGEDEDLLNVALWTEGARKSWCQFQPAAGFDWVQTHLLPQSDFGPLNLGYDDPHYFPKGVPMALLFFHGHKDVADYDDVIEFLKEKGSEVDSANPYVYAGKFYSSFAELKNDDPNLKCLL